MHCILSIASPKSQQTEKWNNITKLEVKLCIISICMIQVYEFIPTKPTAPRCTFSCAELQNTLLIGLGSNLFHILSLLIVANTIFYFIYSLPFLLLNSLKYLCFQSNYDALYKVLASIVVGSYINCGMNFIEFTEVLCWIVSKH